MRASRGLIGLIVLLSAGCSGTSKEPHTGGTGDDTGIIDEDGDGWSSAEDCDDQDHDTHPDALEICNGADDDCDGLVDDGAESTWYADHDEDGYGDAASTASACNRPAGYVPTGNDCDDTDETVFPGSAELCDGADNDCDGETDEDLAATWYADADGDGYGDPAGAVETCEAHPAGTVENGEDCDDRDETAYPGAEEICDGADNDCDSETDEGLGRTWYADMDGDGYGDPDASLLTCQEIPDAYVTDDSDCDDSDAAINPDGAEICDGADNDCDGETDGAFLEADFDAGLPTGFTLNGDASWTSLGTDGFVRLTDVLDGSSTSYDEVGSMMVEDAVDLDTWAVSFTFEITDGVGVIRPDGLTGSGGDGLAFVILDGEDDRFLGAGGEHLGYYVPGATGLAIELDTYCNADYDTSDCFYTYSDYGDPNGNHMALVDVATMEHLDYETDIPALEDTGAYGVEVAYSAGTVRITLSDGTDSWTLADALPFTPTGPLRLGFTGGTGWEINRHEIDDVTLGCP